MIQQAKRPERGCLFYTGIAIVMSMVILIIASYLGYRYAKGLITRFTDTQPMAVPSVQISPEEMTRLKDRIASFSESVEQGKASEPLTVTATEANALIQASPELVTVHGKMFFELEGSNVVAQLSIPAEDLGFKPLQGRYINATGNFTVGFSNGVLNVNARSLIVKGKPFPDTFMGRVLPQNFAYRLNNDPKGQAVLKKLKDIQIKDGKIVIFPAEGP
jgi:hypothetical protein